MARIGSQRHLLLIGVAICLGATAMLGFKAGAQGRAAPTSIAVVDMFRVVNNLDELQQDKTDLDAMQKRYQDEIDQDVAQIQAIESELNELSMTEEEKFEKQARRFELRKNAEAKQQRSVLMLEFEEKRRTIRRYNKLATAAARLAEEQGYDLVLVRSDKKAFGELPDPASNISARELNDVMLLRQMLYVNETLDITEQLIARMNNEFKAGAMHAP